jgi:hypothetical protein
VGRWSRANLVIHRPISLYDLGAFPPSRDQQPTVSVRPVAQQSLWHAIGLLASPGVRWSDGPSFDYRVQRGILGLLHLPPFGLSFLLKQSWPHADLRIGRKRHKPPPNYHERFGPKTYVHLIHLFTTYCRNSPQSTSKSIASVMTVVHG